MCMRYEVLRHLRRAGHSFSLAFTPKRIPQACCSAILLVAVVSFCVRPLFQPPSAEVPFYAEFTSATWPSSPWPRVQNIWMQLAVLCTTHTPHPFSSSSPSSLVWAAPSPKTRPTFSDDEWINQIIIRFGLVVRDSSLDINGSQLMPHDNAGVLYIHSTQWHFFT